MFYHFGFVLTKILGMINGFTVLCGDCRVSMFALSTWNMFFWPAITCLRSGSSVRVRGTEENANNKAIEALKNTMQEVWCY